MSQALSSPLSSSDRLALGAKDMAETTLLSKLVYRSRAVHPLSSLELYKLTLAAQARNRAEAVTGLVLYDKDHFFQWLEGPAESLDRIMRSIRSDPRHTDIEVLDSQLAKARVFTDWSMKLASTGQAAASWRQDVMEPPPGIIKKLRRNPQAAPILLATLMQSSPGVVANKVMEFRAPPQVTLNRQAAAVLKTVIIETIIPKLAEQYEVLRTRSPQLPINKRVWELAELLIGVDQNGALQLIREVQAETPLSLLHYATLFEPAARRLGDLWDEEICTELDVTLGLSRIQTAVRLLSSGVVSRREAMPGPDVLIAPEPGERHSLGAALDSEVMWNVGWNPHCEFPQDDQALEDLVTAKWFDVLDLSLSTAFRREHWLPRLKKTITAAKQASRNPALVVVVGGRLFAEHRAVGAQVNADVASTTAVQVDRLIVERLRQEPDSFHRFGEQVLRKCDPAVTAVKRQDI